MKKRTGITIAALAVSIVLSGCSGQQTGPTEAATQKQEALEPAASAGEDTGNSLRYEDAQYLTMYTSSPGGSMYTIAAAMVPIWEEQGNIIASVGPGGSKENYLALVNGECQIGFTHQCMLSWGEAGVAPFEEKMEGVSSAFILFPAVYHVYASAKNDKVQSVADIGGKGINLALSSQGSLGEVFATDYLKTMYGITPETITSNGGSVSYMSDSEMTSAISDGIVDVGMCIGPYPKTSIQEIENSPGLRLVQFGSDLDQYLSGVTGWTKFELPADTYVGQTEPYETATSWACAAVADSMSEDMVYRLTKITWENIEKSAESSTEIKKYMTLDNQKEAMAGARLHPGAEKYYKEIGLID